MVEKPGSDAAYEALVAESMQKFETEEKRRDEDAMKKAIEETLKMLKAQAENTDTPWKEGDPVYVNSADSREHTDDPDIWTDRKSAGVSCWSNTDIASHYHKTIETALKEIITEAVRAIRLGAEVHIGSYGMSYEATFESEKKPKHE